MVAAGRARASAEAAARLKPARLGDSPARVSPVEAVAALLIVVNMWLLVRRSVWNFAFGIAGVATYGWVFFQARLYSDVLLQVFFAAVQLYGWRRWARRKAAEGDIVVLRMSARSRARWVAGIVALTAGWGWLMHRYTDAAAPWLDAAVAMASVAAQILLTRQRIENWYLWIAVNIMSVILYASRGLFITMVLYVGMLALSVAALIAWRRAERAQRTA